jgi:GNAT superfamily N-acetyltransferase
MITSRAFTQSTATEPAMAGAMRSRLPIDVRVVSFTELVDRLPAFTELLIDTVNGGVPLGWMPPIRREQSREYWLSLHRELHGGSRLLLAAFAGQRLVGSGQLSLPGWPNARHRAELQKLFVATDLRGQGVGRVLLAALHFFAREHGRSLLLLNTRRGEPAERFYKNQGYREAGVLPGWTVGPAGERYDHVTLFQELPV